MRKTVFHAMLIGACIALGVLSGCGKNEVPVERPVGPPSSSGEPLPKADPVLVGETPNCKVYRLVYKPNMVSFATVHVSECRNNITSGIATQ